MEEKNKDYQSSPWTEEKLRGTIRKNFFGGVNDIDTVTVWIYGNFK